MRKLNLYHLFITVLLFTLLSACYYKDEDSTNPSNYGKVNHYRENSNARAYGPHPGSTHNNKALHLDPSLAEQIADMNGVNSAIVAMTEDKAYVAILIDKTAHGTLGSGAKVEVNNEGTLFGNYHPKGNFKPNPRHLATGMNSYDTVENHENIAPNFKQKIAEQVRRLRPHVHEVYISANRDFLNKMTYYSQETWKGNSLAPYIDEFNDMVRNMFGTRRSHK